MSSSIVDKIAKEIGVSPITVTRALNGGGNYRRPSYARRAEHIRALAAEHGYRVNSAAKAMATGRFNAIGYLHSSIPFRSHVNEELLHGIYAELAEHDLYMTSAMLPDEQLTDATRMPKLLRELSADGLLIDYLTQVPEAMSQLIADHQIPSIWINVDRDHDCVRPDDVAIGRMATEHLMDRGCERIAFLGIEKTSHYSFIDRQCGYRAAMRDAGREPVCYVPGVKHYGNRLQLIIDWLDAGEIPDAVVCAHPSTSSPLIAAAMARDLTIGKDLKVVTVGSRVDRSMGIDVTTVLIPFQEVGRRAVSELQRKIADPDLVLDAIAVAPSIETGITT